MNSEKNRRAETILRSAKREAGWRSREEWTDLAASRTYAGKPPYQSPLKLKCFCAYWQTKVRQGDNLFILVAAEMASPSRRLLAMFGEVALWLRVNFFAERRPLNICVTLLDCSERLPRWPDLP
jgi:hypothetical protein